MNKKLSQKSLLVRIRDGLNNRIVSYVGAGVIAVSGCSGSIDDNCASDYD